MMGMVCCFVLYIRTIIPVQHVTYIIITLQLTKAPSEHPKRPREDDEDVDILKIDEPRALKRVKTVVNKRGRVEEGMVRRSGRV